ncbi:MAG: glycosyltransferase family 2 protein [Rhodothermales bacterium]|nr:glycosyltransferase family 2 protein [Rhodothermales bacterium]MBO6780473.1 glycosyltransferase family 2 protein [Rhodothermales bacterium]
MSSSRKLKRKGGKHTLSLCMIVKNEADGLEKCLSTARPHVDEIVVVDTGSTDGTPDIARRYADVYEEIEWPDSFAVARNHSLDLATGEFIMILDGDEFLPDPLHWRRIRKSLAANVACVRMTVRNLLADDQLIAADRMRQLRIFRNAPEVRYEGRVHNQIQAGVIAYANRTGHGLVELDAEIIHTGYAHSESRMKEKYATRMHLLEHEFENARDAQHRAYYGYQLGVVHYVMQEWDKVLDLYGALDYDEMEKGNAFYTHLLASQAALAAGLPARSLVHCNAMFNLDKDEPVAYQITGIALLAGHQFSDGLLMLLEALSMSAEGSRARFMLNPAVLMRKLSRLCRSAGLTRHAEAFERLERAEEFDAEQAKEVIQSLKLGLVQGQRAVA